MMSRDPTAHATAPNRYRPVAYLEPGRVTARRVIGERDRYTSSTSCRTSCGRLSLTTYGGAQLPAKRELASDRRLPSRRTSASRSSTLRFRGPNILVHSERTDPAVGEPVAVGRLVSAAIEREVVRHPGVRVALLGASDAAADGADEVMVTHVIRTDNAIRYGGSRAHRGRRR